MMRGLNKWTWGLLTAFVLLISACTKEAPVSPCTHSDDTSDTGTVKRGNDGGGSDPLATSDPGSSDPAIDGDTEGDDGISDDGDDEADNERSKKKPIVTN